MPTTELPTHVDVSGGREALADSESSEPSADRDRLGHWQEDDSDLETQQLAETVSLFLVVCLNDGKMLNCSLATV